MPGELQQLTRKYMPTTVLAVLALSVFFFSSAFAATDAKALKWGTMAISLLGGLAIFLYGMEKMTEALRAVAGERMKDILAKLTTNRFAGVATGAGVTAIVQSSSVTTVIVVGFVTAGLMNLTQSIGVIFGANIGTTITAQIVAFKVTKYALLMVAVGFGMLFLSKREIIKNYGAMLMGLGLVFFGMAVMGDAMKPLRSYQPFLDLMANMENPLIGILVAAVFTGLVQSSSATTSIVIVMASQGFVTLPAGIALAFGANIGTCVTAMLAAIGKPREAVQAAVAHLLVQHLRCTDMDCICSPVGATGDLYIADSGPGAYRGRQIRCGGTSPDRQCPHDFQHRQHADFRAISHPVRAPGGETGAT